ncbi:hypothetical protein [Parendozoicomonas haliclonae]|uniref:hypothetical protein n=1 Tax=Parendozoicomonas haliclonae TaxID=1960125 RepID=UPI001054D5AA|nr:hypothetical protein [Parendozoicomonas haliclonae]
MKQYIVKDQSGNAFYIRHYPAKTAYEKETLVTMAIIMQKPDEGSAEEYSSDFKIKDGKITAKDENGTEAELTITKEQQITIEVCTPYCQPPTPQGVAVQPVYQMQPQPDVKFTRTRPPGHRPPNGYRRK